ncbi:tigger transposable element-derived protein 4-like [Parasteatoda tepidariorum]|uniref:tigger transposable element-derived protein 4-like n=1 Tax=Parasteatoda tepidariorum TaxID=114398 RepID=UPI0039BCD7A9
MSAKRKTMTLSEKEKIAEDFENSNLSKARFAEERGIPCTTRNNILSSHRIGNGKGERVRFSPFEKIEEESLQWIKMARAQNVPISCSVLKERALQIAAESGEPNFMVSNGWIQRFKVRHDLSFKTVCGEAGCVNRTVLNDWKKSVLEDDILKRCKPWDVFNVDECGLFLRVLPEKL